MLTKRQEAILRLIIQNYTENEIPVGSKTLMQFGIEASSATIRNEMKVLEERGLLTKTHSSSGRVPSMSGYRYYIDHLLQPITSTNGDVEQIKSAFGKDFHEINDVIQQSATILSHLTNYTALSLGPAISDRKLTGFRIIPLNNRQIVAIIVTDKGNVQSQVYTIPLSFTVNDLEMVVKIINDRLVNQSLLTVYHRLRTEIPMIMNRYFQTTDGILDLFDHLLGQVFEERVFVGGRMNVLNFEPNQDVSMMKSMYRFMKDSEQLTQLFTSRNEPIQARIGEELGVDLLQNMSLIQANYSVEGHGSGTIALLGPTSMPYSRMYGLLDTFSQELANALTGYYQELERASQ